MNNLKNYDEFINEEVNWILLKTIGLGALFVVGIPLLFVLFMMIFPTFYGIRLYKRFSGDWRTFARQLQSTMDILWTYNEKIKQIEEHGVNNLDSKQLKIYNKVKKIIKKKLGTDDITHDVIKDYIKKMFDKVSKVKDREYIYNIIDDYDIREYNFDGKNIKKLENIVNVLNLRNGINELDPFGEEDWDEKEFDDDDGGVYYFMKFAKVDGDAGDKQGYLGKGTLREEDGFYKVGNMSVDKEDFKYALNKYYKQINMFGFKNQVKINGAKARNTLVIIPEDKKEIYEDIIKSNFNWIKANFNVFKKKVGRFNVDITNRLGELVNEMNPYDLIKLIDDGYEFKADNSIDLMNYQDHIYLLGKDNIIEFFGEQLPPRPRRNRNQPGGGPIGRYF